MLYNTRQILPFVNTPSALPLISCISRPPRRILLYTDLSVLSSLDTRNRFSSFLVVVFSSSSFFFSVVVVVVVLLLPQNIGVLESHSTSNNDVSFPAFFPFFRLFHTFFFLSPPLPHEESLLLSSSTTSSRALKKSSHDDDDDDDESKNISVASSSFFSDLSLFSFCVKSNTLLCYLHSTKISY